MVRILAVALLTVSFGAAGTGFDSVDASASGQDRKKKQDTDQTKGKKAPACLLKAVGTMLKLKGYHCTEEVTAAGEGPATFKGVVKGDFCAMSGAEDMYARKNIYLLKSGGRYVPPEDAQGDDGRIAAVFRNPYLFLLDLKKLGRITIWNGEETIDDVDCRIAETSADEKTMMDQINQLAKGVKELKEFGITNVSGFIDKKESRSLYRIWIGKKDLQIHKMTWELEPVIKEGSIPGGFEPPTDELRADYALTLSKFNEDLDVDIPKEVQVKLKVK